MKALPLMLMIAPLLLASLSMSQPASAAGCLRGAVVGGVAGHYVGHHGLVGAGVGCAIGHHEAEKRMHEEERYDHDYR